MHSKSATLIEVAEKSEWFTFNIPEDYELATEQEDKSKVVFEDEEFANDAADCIVDERDGENLTDRRKSLVFWSFFWCSINKLKREPSPCPPPPGRRREVSFPICSGKKLEPSLQI